MNRLCTIPLAFAAVISVLAQPAHAQPRGRELYDLMARERLTTTTGRPQVEWLWGGRGYYASAPGTRAGHVQIDPRTDQATPLFDDRTLDALVSQYEEVTGTQVDRLPFSQFTFVNNGEAITFTHGSSYFHFDLRSNTLREMLRPEVARQPNTDGLMRGMAGSQLWNGTYSPDYSQFAYVKGYDLYVTNTDTGVEKRLSFDGNEDTFNGRPNWVYPEEFGQRDAYWFSPDSKKLAYFRSDESAVHKYPIVHDLSPEADVELQSYPKAGEPNPTVVLRIVDIESGETVEVQTNSNANTYIVRPYWLPDGSEILIRRINSRQHVVELLAANVTTGIVRTVLVEEEPAFVNLHDDFRLLEDGRRFLWSSERSGYRHLYLYDLDGNELAQLTSGDWPVNSLTCVDENEEWVYFTGTTELGLESHFFRVRLDGSGFQQLTTESGSHRISMDPAGRYYVDSYSSFTTPPTANIHTADGSLLRNLMTTGTERLDGLGLEHPELVIVKAADGVTDLHGVLFKPAGYDSDLSYPLVVPVYGGPHSKAISNRYYHSSGDQRLAQLGFMVWRVDNRGQTGRGKAFETATYMKLGQVDLADQAAAVRQIAERPYVDGSRVGIYGGSYGGYMTAMALLKEPDVFDVGVASASVTDWRNYDTIYTERYMRTPQENPEGYDRGSTFPYAENLRGKLLLTHGTTDNNVHLGNTNQLVEALINAGRRFDLMYFPENRHGARGAAARFSQELRIDYLVEHLNPPDYPWGR